jgi:hypothetical protein
VADIEINVGLVLLEDISELNVRCKLEDGSKHYYRIVLPELDQDYPGVINNRINKSKL